MARLFHVTPVRNRESILVHGLDWTWMAAAPGIAGSTTPEEEGVFLSRDELDAEFFVRINNTGGPVDVWAVDGIDEGRLVTTGGGFEYVPFTVAVEHLVRIRSDVEPAARNADRDQWPGVSEHPRRHPGRRHRADGRRGAQPVELAAIGPSRNFAVAVTVRAGPGI